MSIQTQQIPAGWKIISFEDCLIPGNKKLKGLKRSQYKTIGAYPIIDQGNSFISGYTDEIDMVYKLESPIILFGDHTRILKYIDFPFAIGADGTKIFQIKSAINPKFFYYYLINTKIPNTGYNRHYKYLKGLNINLPSYSVQIKITTILSKVDEEIEKVERIIEQTERLKKGLMQRLLTQGIGHTKFKKTELGEIPEEWEVKKLGKILKFENGKAHEKLIVEEGNYIVVNSKFISSDGTVLKYSNENLKPLLKGDIAMVMSDVPNGLALGKCFLVPEDDKYTLNQRICSLRPIDGDSQFYFYVLSRNQYFLSFDNGVGQTNLRKNEVLECPLPVPPPLEQKQIAKIIESLMNHITVNQRIKSRLLKLKKGLMNDLLSGRIRVRAQDLKSDFDELLSNFPQTVGCQEKKAIFSLLENVQQATQQEENEILRAVDFNKKNIEKEKLEAILAELRSVIFLRNNSFSKIRLCCGKKKQKGVDITAEFEDKSFAIEVKCLTKKHSRKKLSVLNIYSMDDNKLLQTLKTISESAKKQLDSKSSDKKMIIFVLNRSPDSELNTYQQNKKIIEILRNNLNWGGSYYFGFISKNGLEDFVSPVLK